MIKKTILLTLLLCGALALVSCGKKDESVNDMVSYTSGEVILGQYKELTYTPVSTEVTEEEIQAEIKTEVLEEFVEKVEITDRPIQKGDFANINFEGFLDEVAFENGKGENFDLEIGSDRFIAGFEDGLIGAVVNQELDLNLTFPDGYDDADLAGKDVVFKVKVNSIIEKKYPELTDKMVKDKTDYKTIEEYKKALEEKISTQKISDADNRKRNEVMLKAIENATFKNDLTKEIEEAIEVEKSYWENVAQTYYQLDAKTFFKQAQGFDETEYEEYMKTLAENSVKQEKILNAIIEAESITLSEDEYKQGLETYTLQGNFSSTEEFLKSAGGEEKVKFVFMLNKAEKFIYDSAIAK